MRTTVVESSLFILVVVTLTLVMIYLNDLLHFPPHLELTRRSTDEIKSIPIISHFPTTVRTSTSKILSEKAFLVQSEPADACGMIKVKRKRGQFETMVTKIRDQVVAVDHHFLLSWILFAEEGGCDTNSKVENAQKAGYSSLLILCKNPKTSSEIYRKSLPINFQFLINVSFIRQEDGEDMKKSFLYPKRLHAKFFNEQTMLALLSDQFVNYWVVQWQFLKDFVSICSTPVQILLSLFPKSLKADVLLYVALLFLFSPLIFIYYGYKVDRVDYDHFQEEDQDWNGRPRREEFSSDDNFESADENPGENFEIKLQNARLLLGLPVDQNIFISKQDIESACRLKCRDYHPDKLIDCSPEEKERRNEIFLELQAAKNLLISST